MKNISELIIDLAYSSLIFQDEEIAEEVKSLRRSAFPEVLDSVLATTTLLLLGVRELKSTTSYMGLTDLSSTS